VGTVQTVGIRCAGVITPEGKVKKRVRELLDEAGCYYFFPATGGYGKSGVPDIVGCYRGYFFAIECKAGDNKPTALQLKNLVEIYERGGWAIVVNEQNINDVLTVLKGIENAAVHSQRRAGSHGRVPHDDGSKESRKERDVGAQNDVDHRGASAPRQGKRISVSEGE
jgi:hypothetical protein